MKSIHMCHLLLDFCTRTTLAIQVGYFICMMNPTLDSFPTSSPMKGLFSSPTFRFLYATGLEEGWMVRRWLTTLVSIPITSDGARANNSTFLMSWSNNSYSSSLEMKFLSLWPDGQKSISEPPLSPLWEWAFVLLCLVGGPTLEVIIWNFKWGTSGRESSSLSISRLDW